MEVTTRRNSALLSWLRRFTYMAGQRGETMAGRIDFESAARQKNRDPLGPGLEARRGRDEAFGGKGGLLGPRVGCWPSKGPIWRNKLLSGQHGFLQKERNNYIMLKHFGFRSLYHPEWLPFGG